MSSLIKESPSILLTNAISIFNWLGELEEEEIVELRGKVRAQISSISPVPMRGFVSVSPSRARHLSSRCQVSF